MSKKISELPAAATVGEGDYIPIVQDGVTKRAAVGQLPAGDVGGGSDMSAVTALSIAAGVVAVDCSLGDYFTLALTANVTSITFSNLPGSGKGATKMIRFTQDAVVPRTVAWPASFKWENATPNAISSTESYIDVLAITTFDNGATWRATLGKNWS